MLLAPHEGFGSYMLNLHVRQNRSHLSAVHNSFTDSITKSSFANFKVR